MANLLVWSRSVMISSVCRLRSGRSVLPFIVVFVSIAFGGAEANTVCSSFPSSLTRVGDNIVFFARLESGDYQLWKSDGSDGGTSAVADLPTGTRPVMMSASGREYGLLESVRYISTAGSEAFFVVRGFGLSELWITDGSVDGTRPVFDTREVSALLSDTATLSGSLYFAGHDRTPETDLWRTDGDPGHAEPVFEADGNASGRAPSSFVSHGRTLFFAASATAEFTGAIRLWATSGDGGSAVLYAREPDRAHPFLDIFSIVPHGSDVLFLASRLGSGSEMWLAPGPDSVAVPMSEILGSTRVYSAVATDNRLLVFTTVDYCNERFDVWGSEGTVTEAEKLVELYADGPCHHPVPVSARSGSISYFSFFDGASWDLWRTDMSAVGTELVAILGSEMPNGMTTAGEFLFVRTGRHPAQLWRSDGTEEGTTKLGFVDVGAMAALGNDLLVSANDGTVGMELYRIDSDGEPALVRDILRFIGDCNDDGVVSIDELIVGARIALESLPAASCLAFDPDRDGTVTVADLTAAVQSSLVGCS